MAFESGSISAKAINQEWNRWGGQNYQGTFRLWTDGSGLINKGSKPISYSDFRGQSSAAPIESTISGGSFTTSGGNKIGTITNTNACGSMTIVKVASGSLPRLFL